jgi:hypothetical protein
MSFTHHFVLLLHIRPHFLLLLPPLVLHLLLQLEPALAVADFAVANFLDSPERGQHFP